MINKVQKAGERLRRNKAARVQRLKAKSDGSFQDAHKKYVIFSVPKPAGFCKVGPGNIRLFDDCVLFHSGALGLSPGAVSGWQLVVC